MFRLIAFQNVNEALDETESKAWQKLLSVMTHEIMNSIAPISSLADTLKNRLQRLVGNLQSMKLAVLKTWSWASKPSRGEVKAAEVCRNLS
jgi:hypothetical protein